MRFLILLLFSLTSFAQKTIIIKDDNNAPIIGASVFLVTDKNNLVAVSDQMGSFSLDLKDDQKYLFHSLGFIDTTLTSNALTSKHEIVLKSANYILKEVNVSSSLSTFVITQPRSDEYKTFSDFPQNANIQRVNLIKIDTGGYLKSLKLFCRIYVKEVIPNYRFMLYAEKDGKPDSLILPLKIDGKVSKKEINFDLSKTNYYLEKGNYFIGYETFDGKAVIKKQIFNDKKIGQLIRTPIVIFASNEKKTSYHRQNLSKWYVPRMGNMVNGKVIWEDNLSQNFAYELHLLH
jgi:hypothetical protein